MQASWGIIFSARGERGKEEGGGKGEEEKEGGGESKGRRGKGGGSLCPSSQAGKSREGAGVAVRNC